MIPEKLLVTDLRDSQWLSKALEDLNFHVENVLDISREQTVQAKLSKIKAFQSSKPIARMCVVVDNGMLGMSCFPNNTVDIRKHGFKDGWRSKSAREVAWILAGFGHDAMKDDIWFTSDTHFGHANIIKYCNRPYKDTEEMNADLIKRWNSTVGKDDLVWHLGDFSLGGIKVLKTVFPQLNGRINLVLGNHDTKPLRYYYDVGFNKVYDRPIIWNEFFILSHEPLEYLNDTMPFFNIAGHVHDNALYSTWTRSSFIACVERHDYKPVSWKSILEKVKKMNDEKDSV